jgi:ribosomal protein S18 acetylase RimI-like enzyme
MEIKIAKNKKAVQKIMKSFWKKDADFSKVKLVSTKPIWFYIEDDSKLVGFINGFINDYGNCKIAEITNIEIKSESRKKGYSKKLMEKFISFCKSKSVESIYLRVEKKNKIAQDLYSKYGFKKDKEGISMELHL